MVGKSNTPFEERRVSSDIERILVFEWTASHFESLHRWLPPHPETLFPLKGLDAESWHSASLRLAALRKFCAGNEDVRLDKVWRSLLAVNAGTNVAMANDVKSLINAWDDILKDMVQRTVTTPDGTHTVESGEFFDLFNYGVILHADAGKGRTLRAMGVGVGSGLWHALAPTKIGESLPVLVLRTLETVRKGRREGYLAGLPDPYPVVWPGTDANPRDDAGESVPTDPKALIDTLTKREGEDRAGAPA